MVEDLDSRFSKADAKCLNMAGPNMYTPQLTSVEIYEEGFST